MTIIMFFVLIGVACAGTTVTLQWNPNSEPDLAGYRIYQDGIQVAEIPCTANDNSCCEWTSEELPEPHKWYVTAYDTDGFESKPSNMVDSYPPNAPKINIIVNLQVTVNP